MPRVKQQELNRLLAEAIYRSGVAFSFVSIYYYFCLQF
jgi:hypothetical protein